ncbi:MAG: L,D-transpeptidase family protein [Alphaproteobacteria bacterium]|nr:L,D-transpeptidase family protein [Alphaproteobacteria bacterium]
MHPRHLLLAPFLALAACTMQPVAVAPPAPAAVAAGDDQLASLPAIGLAGAATLVRYDVVPPPPLPRFRRVSLTPPADPVAPPPALVDRIVVHKMDRRMELMKDGAAVRTYRIDLGWQTLGHKQHEGDGRTPEGVYTIEGRNPRSGFHRALKISYPSAEDRARANGKGMSPGGLIMIHGQPNDPRSYERAQKKRDWTEGCIAVRNDEIEEIWAFVGDGTTIEILP